MIISFASEDLCRLCEQEKVAKRKLGSANAKKLHSRLSDLMAVARVTDLAAGNPHPLKGDRLGQFSLSLHGASRLVFEVANSPVPKTPDGAIDWSGVTQVHVIFVGDYHD